MDGVSVRLVGSFAVFRGGSAEPVRPGSRKARRLLALLAVQRDRLVPLERIVDALWPATPPRRPGPDVATLVSRLRAALGGDAIRSDRGGYRLGEAPFVVVDLDEAAVAIELCARLAGSPDAPVAGHRALALLATGSVLLDEPDADWVREARTRYERLLRDARHAAATAALHAGDAGVAREIAEAAIREDHLDEGAHRLLMAALQAVGEPAQALVDYQRMRALLTNWASTRPRAPGRCTRRCSPSGTRDRRCLSPGPRRPPLPSRLPCPSCRR
jgi:DNA-binding SARP family transcriptional activator